MWNYPLGYFPCARYCARYCNYQNRCSTSLKELMCYYFQKLLFNYNRGEYKGERGGRLSRGRSGTASLTKGCGSWNLEVRWRGDGVGVGHADVLGAEGAQICAALKCQWGCCMWVRQRLNVRLEKAAGLDERGLVGHGGASGIFPKSNGSY